MSAVDRAPLPPPSALSTATAYRKALPLPDHRAVDKPNSAIQAILDKNFTLVRPLPPDGLLLQTEDGVLWQLFAHRAPGLP